jgi:hypothetical protein
MKICLVGDELFRTDGQTEGQTDGHTDMTKPHKNVLLAYLIRHDRKVAQPIFKNV